MLSGKLHNYESVQYLHSTLLARNDTIPAGYKKCALIMPLFMSTKIDPYCQKWTDLNPSNQKTRAGILPCPGFNIDIEILHRLKIRTSAGP